MNILIFILLVSLLGGFLMFIYNNLLNLMFKFSFIVDRNIILYTCLLLIIISELYIMIYVLLYLTKCLNLFSF